MKEVYTDRDSARVGLLNGILNEAGIRTVVKNWNGSNITQIPIPLFYPAIYLLNPEDESKAQSLLEEFQMGFKAESGDWTCQGCGVNNDGIYSECWNCQKEHLV